MIPCSPEAFQLMMEGSATFADMETNGIHIDVPYLKRMDFEVQQKIEEMEEKLRKDPIGMEWKKIYGANADFGKREQLASILFNVLKVEPKSFTKGGKPATSKEALEDIEHPFLERWENIDALRRLRSTNIQGILEETVDGILRPFINLNTAITYRSSCSRPNGHSIPNRDRRLAKIIRRGIIPSSSDFVIGEADFSGAEVRGACPYHKDPTMIKYLEEDYDLHLDMGAECYKLTKDQVSKPIRGAAKGMFVFASFYGDWYQKICQNMWRAVESEKLKLKDGTSLREHLNKVGLKELGNLNPKNILPGSFEEHMREVEYNFWNNRFPVYTEWKERWWNEYLEKGWFQMLTGFVYRGVYERNQVINGPIQGTAFHWLLWVAIELNKWLKQKKMRTTLILQIHDSVILNLYRKEIQDVLTKIKELVTIGLKKRWDWINVPLAVETSICEEHWFGKEEWVDYGGTWAPKKAA